MSENFSYYPPTDSEISECEASIDIKKIEIIDGGIEGRILDTFELLLRGRIEKEVNDVICEELEFLDQIIMSLIEIPADFFIKYSEPLSDERLDVLFPEKNFEIPVESSLLIFPENEIFRFISDWIKSQFGSNDGSETLGMFPNKQELGIDDIIQSNYSIPGAALIDNGILYEDQDMITDIQIVIDEVRIIGLDNVIDFDALSAVGNYTISNHIAWKSLGIELYMTVSIKPSNASNSITEDHSIAEVVEQILIATRIDDIDLNLSIFMALDLNKLTLGKILKIRSFDDFLSCIGDSLYSLEMSGLSVSVAKIDPPVLKGFISDGIDRVVGNLATGIFDIYETLFVSLLPNIFEIGVRDGINNQIESILDDKEGTCQILDYSSSNGFVNFLDLFLAANESLSAGGSGTNPYGE